MKHMNCQLIAALFAMVCGALLPAKNALAQSAQGDKSELAGLASVSGTVKSYAPFKAAKVYFRNVWLLPLKEEPATPKAETK